MPDEYGMFLQKINEISQKGQENITPSRFFSFWRFSRWRNLPDSKQRRLQFPEAPIKKFHGYIVESCPRFTSICYIILLVVIILVTNQIVIHNIGVFFSGFGRRTLTQQQSDTGLYLSSFHVTPERRKFSKQGWEKFTKDSTEKALEELVSSPGFGKWLYRNADRVSVSPNSGRAEQQRKWFLWS